MMTLIAAVMLTLAAILMLVRARAPAAAADNPNNSPRFAWLAAALFAVAAAINWLLYFTRT